MAEPPVSAQVSAQGGTDRKTVQKYLENKEFLRAWTRSPLELANWFLDGTLIFATQETDHGERGLSLTKGLAAQYQNQFRHSPELVAALGRAFTGDRVT